MEDVKSECTEQPLEASITEVKQEIPSSMDAQVDQTECKTESAYAGWTKQQLKEGIKQVQAQLRDLENEQAGKAERKRQKERAELIAGIEDVKANLSVLGVETAAPEQKKGGRKGGGRKGRKKGKKAKRSKWLTLSSDASP